MVVERRPEQHDVAPPVDQGGQTDGAKYAHIERPSTQLNLHLAGIGSDPVQGERVILVEPVAVDQRFPGGTSTTCRWKV